MSDLLIREFDILKPGKYMATLRINEDGTAGIEVTWTRPFEKPRSTTGLPITVLPKGHGRLIDADAMLSKFVQDVHGLDGAVRLHQGEMQKYFTGCRCLNRRSQRNEQYHRP